MRSRVRHIAAIPFAALVMLFFGGAAAAAGRLSAEGTVFVLTLADGRALRGEELAGASFVWRGSDTAVTIRIDGVEREDSTSGPVLIYRLSLRDPRTGSSRPLCRADAKGREAGLPIPRDDGGYSLTCTSGAEGKCILMGYHPWQVRADGAPMRDLHRACVHLIRADYGGDDRPTTRDGTSIDIYDRFGIQSPIHSSMTFEAAWGPDGAVCVARPRVPDNVTLEEIGRRYPRLRRALGPETCDEGVAQRHPEALLFNRSLPSNTAPRR
jgi:ADYC domain